MRRPTAKCDRAIILTLLDTGLRASKLCALKIRDVDQKTGKVQIKHGRLGGAKGGKGRTVFLGKAVRRGLWLYLSSREDGEDADAPLFVGKFNRPMNRDVLRQVMASLGEKAQVKNCHPHRFRQWESSSHFVAKSGVRRRVLNGLRDSHRMKIPHKPRILQALTYD